MTAYLLARRIIKYSVLSLLKAKGTMQKLWQLSVTIINKRLIITACRY